MTIKKIIYIAMILFVLYYIFIANIMITLSVIAILYIAFKIYKIYARKKLIKISSSKELFAQSELGLFIALVAKVAKADGRIDELEAQLIGNMFDDISKIFPDKDKTRRILKEIFNEEKEKNDDTKEVAKSLNALLGRSVLKRKQFLGFLIQLASAGNGMNDDEDKVLRTIVLELNMTLEQYSEMIQKFENMLKNKQTNMSVEEAYKVLGVNKDEDMSSIKKAYRKLVRQYHPDIIKSQDKDEKYMEESTLKTQEINQAYEIIKEFKK